MCEYKNYYKVPCASILLSCACIKCAKIAKAEFDSALSDFNSRLTTFEAGINSKIDAQVTSYLDRNGIWSGKEQVTVDKTKACVPYLYVRADYLNSDGTILKHTEKFKINNVEYKSDDSLPVTLAGVTYNAGKTVSIYTIKKSFLKPNKSGLMCLNSQWRAPSFWTGDISDRFYYFSMFEKLKFNGDTVTGYDTLTNSEGYWNDNVWTNNRELDWRIWNDTDNIALSIMKKNENGTYTSKLNKTVGEIKTVKNLNDGTSARSYRWAQLLKITWGKAFDYFFVSKNDDLYFDFTWNHTVNTWGSADEFNIIKNYLTWGTCGGIMWYVDSAAVY